MRKVYFKGCVFIRICEQGTCKKSVLDHRSIRKFHITTFTVRDLRVWPKTPRFVAFSRLLSNILWRRHKHSSGGFPGVKRLYDHPSTLRIFGMQPLHYFEIYSNRSVSSWGRHGPGSVPHLVYTSPYLKDLWPWFFGTDVDERLSHPQPVPAFL